jgi:hypothetical protein
MSLLGPAPQEMVAERVELPGSTGNKQKFAVVVRNVLSLDECQALIDRTESEGYEKALVNVGGGRQALITDYRNSQRCIIDDAELANQIGQRLEPHIPNEFKRGQYISLNERLRFLKYTAGDFFAPHSDGSYVRDNGETSHITLMLYLNSGAEGGQTRFHSDEKGEDFVDVVPEPGLVLMFEHRILHEGVLVEGGVKYAMRTDVMYTR